GIQLGHIWLRQTPLPRTRRREPCRNTPSACAARSSSCPPVPNQTHRPPSPARSAAQTVGHGQFEVNGLLPRRAVPTRTHVEPHSMACSRSPLIPAESSTALGCAFLSRATAWLSLAKAASGGQPSGATAITPCNCNDGATATWSARPWRG